MDSVTVLPILDGWVVEYNLSIQGPGLSFSAGELRVRGASAGTDPNCAQAQDCPDGAVSLLKFAPADLLSAVPVEFDPADIEIAELTLYQFNDGARTQTIRVERIVESWSESDISYSVAQAGTFAETNDSASLPVSGSTPVTLDITEIVRGWVSGDPAHGLRVRTVDTSDEMQFYSGEADSAFDTRKPRLRVEFKRLADG